MCGTPICGDGLRRGRERCATTSPRSSVRRCRVCPRPIRRAQPQPLGLQLGRLDLRCPLSLRRAAGGLAAPARWAQTLLWPVGCIGRAGCGRTPCQGPFISLHLLSGRTQFYCHTTITEPILYCILLWVDDPAQRAGDGLGDLARTRHRWCDRQRIRCAKIVRQQQQAGDVACDGHAPGRRVESKVSPRPGH